MSKNGKDNLRILEVKPVDLNFADYKKRRANEDDCSQLIDYDCLVTVDGIPKILYKKIEVDTSPIRWAVKNIKYSSSTRTDGLKTTSAIFGFSPRNVLRKDFCSATAMAKSFPKPHYVICNFSKELTKLYEEYFPETIKRHYELADKKVRDDWKMEGTPFTSGIVNKNNPLKYHHDSGNFKNVLSNMLVLKRGVTGGRLACPEFDIKFECSDDYVVIFDGAQILHGVTPIIKPEGDDTYRYTVVYYSLEQMWKCDSVNEEVKRIRKVKKEREFKRFRE
jgi:hypothetical protein